MSNDNTPTNTNILNRNNATNTNAITKSEHDQHIK